LPCGLPVLGWAGGCVLGTVAPGLGVGSAVGTVSAIVVGLVGGAKFVLNWVRLERPAAAAAKVTLGVELAWELGEKGRQDLRRFEQEARA